MFLEAIDCWVEENRESILDLNRSLVSIPSENRCPEGGEGEVQEFVERYLGDLRRRPGHPGPASRRT